MQVLFPDMITPRANEFVNASGISYAGGSSGWTNGNGIVQLQVAAASQVLIQSGTPQQQVTTPPAGTLGPPSSLSEAAQGHKTSCRARRPRGHGADGRGRAPIRIHRNNGGTPVSLQVSSRRQARRCRQGSGRRRCGCGCGRRDSPSPRAPAPPRLRGRASSCTRAPAETRRTP